jgi:hypothetical protein
VLKLKNINIEEDKIKELKKSKKFKRRMNLNKDDIIKEIALLKPNLERNYLIKLKKLELVQIWFSLEVKGEKNTTVRRQGRRKRVFEQEINKETLYIDNIEKSKYLEVHGFKFLKKNQHYTPKFEEVYKDWGAENLSQFFRTYVDFWYSNNGWNGYNLGDTFGSFISDSEKSKVYNRLPLSSFKFEEYCKSLIDRNKELKVYKNFTIIKERRVRKGYCSNLGCNPAICDFIFKYKVEYVRKYAQFYYTVYLKGNHDPNFIIGESKKYYMSFDTKSILNDGILNHLSTDKIIEENDMFRTDKTNVYNEKNYKITPTEIKNKRYRNKLNINGSYKQSFDKAVKAFSKRSFKYLRLIFYDEKNLTMTFMVYDKELFSKFKNINQIYIDATFKTKFMGCAHYNVLVFAVNIPGSLRTIPIAFTISFKGRSHEYQLTWKSFKRVIEKHICLDYFSLISDLGSAERKFSNIEEEPLRLLKYILCWFHTFQKCFLPRITNFQNKNLIPKYMT